MSFRTIQSNFSRGVLAPALYGRFDVDAWQAALRVGVNVIVLKYGGLTKRPGTRLVAEVLDDSAPNRLIPFQFSLEQTYALEFGQGYMSPLAGGGRVAEEELAITNITNAAQAEVTAANHGYSAGNLVYLSGIAGGLGDLLNGRAWSVVASTGDDTFTIAANTMGYGAFAGATGGITRADPPAPDPAPPPVPPVYEEPPPPWTYGGPGWEWLLYYQTGYPY